MFKKLAKIFDESDFREIIKKASFYLVFRGLAFFLAYLFAIQVINNFDSSAYGYVSLGFSILMIVSVLCRLGFDITLTKIFSIENSLHAQRTYLGSLVLTVSASLFFSGLIFFSSEEISTYIFNKNEFSDYLKVTAISIPLWTLLLINIGVFKGVKKVIYYSTLDNFGRFFFSILILQIFLWFNLKNETTPLLAHTIGLALLLIISFYGIKKQANLSSQFKPVLTPSIINSSLQIMLSSAIVIMLSWSDKIIVGIYDTSESVGIYDIAVRVATLITFNLDAINSILSSKISKYYHEHNYLELSKVVQFSTKVNIIISFLAFLIILVFSKQILHFFGAEFIEGSTALIILAIGQLFNSFCGPVGNLLNMTGNHKEFRNVIFISLLINIVLNFVLIKDFGINGAATATTISLIAWNLLGVIIVKKKLHIYSYYNPFLK